MAVSHPLRSLCRFLHLMVLMLVFAALSAAAESFAVSQRNRAFALRQVTIGQNDVVRFSNEDDYAHQLRINGPGVDFDSDLQSPGETIDVPFPTAGSYEVRCGIHPRMRMTVVVH